jgi:hypothetical protein
MCNGCWELDSRIRMQPELARRILEHDQTAPESSKRA